MYQSANVLYLGAAGASFVRDNQTYGRICDKPHHGPFGACYRLVWCECRVRQIIPLGSHDMFLADVVNVLVDEEYINPETGKLELERADMIAYSHGEYFRLGQAIGHFGWSVRKKKKRSMRR